VGARRRLLFFALSLAATSVFAMSPAVSLRETVAKSPLHDLDTAKNFAIRGRAASSAGSRIWLRVTDSLGQTFATETTVRNGEFSALFPSDFAPSGALKPAVYFIDAAPAADAEPGARAEATVIVYSTTLRQIPEFPTAFTTNLRGETGDVDAASPEWPRTRALVNLFYRSRGAYLAGRHFPQFDLANASDLAAFKRDLALYDFDARDRDWSTPLGRRPARSFWQAVWDSWFGPTNSTERPPGSGRYAPFTFANDTADILVAHLRRWQLREVLADPLEDDLATMCREVLLNLVAMQRRENDPVPPQRAVEGPGAFYYGMFSDGELMLDGTGWFHNPNHGDHHQGGVFLGRSLWAVGEALGHPLPGMQEEPLRESFRAGLRWAFGHAIDLKDHDNPYVRRIKSRTATKTIRYLWRSPGEHAYLLLGLLAACERQEIGDLVVFEAGEFHHQQTHTVRSLTEEALQTLADAVQPQGFWSTYADIDATAVEAMAKGAKKFPHHPHAARWRSLAMKVADGWLNARPAPDAYRAEPILPVGRRTAAKPDELRYEMPGSPSTHLTFFHAGLWLQALAELESLTGEARYRARFEKILGYFCGNNPFEARLLTETGGVYNFVTDTDGDTIEDRLHFDLYPESTAFVQIGLFRHLQHLISSQP